MSFIPHHHHISRSILRLTISTMYLLHTKNPLQHTHTYTGYIGKLRVHDSGRMTLKAGEVIYEVQPGLPCYFAQDVAALWPDKKQLCMLGKLNKKLVCLPEFSALALDEEEGPAADSSSEQGSASRGGGR